MRLRKRIPPKIEIPSRPTCPVCGTRMWLARIEPDIPDHDKRTLECPECDYAIIEVVKYK